MHMHSTYIPYICRIDKPVRQQLAAGKIRLLNCSWLCSSEADTWLARDPITRAIIMDHSLPSAAFLEPRQAVQLIDASKL